MSLNHNDAGPEQTALAYLESVRRLDTDAMQGFFADDAKAWLPGQGWMTPAQLAELLGGARSLLVDGIRFAHEGTLVSGKRVVVMTRCESPLIRGGVYENEFCFVFTFDDAGKIAELREYTDSGPAVAAFHS